MPSKIKSMPNREPLPMTSDIIERTKAYEAWMRGRTKLVDRDLALKHKRMSDSPFPFLRATFYRWVELWRETCADEARGPTVLAVGDLHIENFGTWRDAEGRLVWGINDFDEAWPMPYAIDLVRLATSALLAIKEDALSLKGEDACAAILRGYTEGMAGRGTAFVLEEAHEALRAMALSEARDPVRFWAKMNAFPKCRVPPDVIRLLTRQLPEPDLSYRIVHRVAGLGSLGRQRYVALAPWHGGMVAREAKTLLPSAYAWALGKRAKDILYLKIAARAVRCPDPFLQVKDGWLCRRLAPHCSRIELSALPKRADEALLLHAMGQETANVHHGTSKAISALRKHLAGRKRSWLFDAAQKMAEATMRDWKRWKAEASKAGL